MSKYLYTSQKQVRAAFWRENPGVVRRRVDGLHGQPVTARQNQQPADTRAAFVVFVDQLERNGTISERLAAMVTL